MGAVPRIFEKTHARVEGMIAEQGGLKKRIFDWAVGVGLKVSRARQAGLRPSLPISLQHRLADRLVLSTIRARFGGRLRFFISGSAALDRAVAQWFDAVGITVLEGYGLTETSAASFLNLPAAYRLGTVGWPFPSTKVADDGEILLRGAGVMSTYHDLPEATAEALESDGWFHTGDIGEIDADGFSAPDTQADVTYLQLLDQNGVSYRNPEAMVSFAHDLVDGLSASPQNDANVGSIVRTGEERISQHDMGVIIAAAVVAYRPSLIPVVGHWADSAAGYPCGSAAQGVLR